MKSAIKQAIILVVISAIIGGILNVIRADRVSWISKKVEFQVADRSTPDSLADLSGSPYPRLIQIDGVDMRQGKDAVIIDSRLPEFYRDGHIPGAINIPFEDLDPYLRTLFALPKDTMVIVYCDGGDCELSYDLAVYMIQRGFVNIFEYQGGWEEWDASGRPVSKGDKP